MIKIPCLFVRSFHAKHELTLTDAVSPGCEWVLAGEGSASVKRDGDPDPITGHWPHGH